MAEKNGATTEVWHAHAERMARVAGWEVREPLEDWKQQRIETADPECTELAQTITLGRSIVSDPSIYTALPTETAKRILEAQDSGYGVVLMGSHGSYAGPAVAQLAYLLGIEQAGAQLADYRTKANIVIGTAPLTGTIGNFDPAQILLSLGNILITSPNTETTNAIVDSSSRFSMRSVFLHLLESTLHNAEQIVVAPSGTPDTTIRGIRVVHKAASGFFSRIDAIAQRSDIAVIPYGICEDILTPDGLKVSDCHLHFGELIDLGEQNISSAEIYHDVAIGELTLRAVEETGLAGLRMEKPTRIHQQNGANQASARSLAAIPTTD